MGPEEDVRDAQRLQSLCYGHRLRAGGDPALGGCSRPWMGPWVADGGVGPAQDRGWSWRVFEIPLAPTML